MNIFHTFVDLNILPLDSYDVLIGMDWLDAHHIVLDCHKRILLVLMKKGIKG
jgi:hypothetical protein